MISQPFEYSRPGTLAEALELLSGGSTKPLAGGMSLIPMMKLRLAAPEHLIDLSRIPGLDAISEGGGSIRIGALATHYGIESSALIRAKCPLLAETAGRIGDVQVRNSGTIGGSVAHADPSSDYAAALLALDATVHIAGRRGNRSLPYAEFLVDTFTTLLEPGELVEAIEIPAENPSTGSSYQKMVQPASGFAIVGVAARVARIAGKITFARIGITGLGSKAFRAVNVEALLLAGNAAAAAAAAGDGIEANSDLHASSHYRSQMVKVYCARAISTALSRAA
ncbi:MAG: xanthine dehydrogenase family protein subunit M [Bryobacterales bacterium]|nr:xanthine dehydrogenase family protein subunit M [Bryobacterales bacterium]